MRLSRRQSKAKTLVLTSFLAVLGACGTRNSEHGETKVTNGREIQENEFPSVVLLVISKPEGQGMCTGTFVNSSQIVTAGHCVEGLDPENPALFYATKNADGVTRAVAKAISFKRNPAYSFDLGVSSHDVSILTFKDGTAPAVSELATGTPKAGDTLTIVGYGNNENTLASGGPSGKGAGIKRVGSNQVGKVSDGLIMFIGTPTSSSEKVSLGEYSISGAGDSGGPLFINGQLAGVTSGGGFTFGPDKRAAALSQYVDLTSEESRSFLTETLKP